MAKLVLKDLQDLGGILERVGLVDLLESKDQRVPRVNKVQ